MHTYNTYAARSAKAPLEHFTFDPGPLGPEEVEIKVSHCGICHSDLSMLDNDWHMSKYPFVPGHEVTGTVSALGEQAKGLKTGQRVGLGWWSHSCLSCHQCLSGDHNLCSTAQGTIVGRHGGFADRVRAQWTWVAPDPRWARPGEDRPVALRWCYGVRAVPGSQCAVHRTCGRNRNEAEAYKLGAHFVHNTKQDGALKKIAGSLNLIISTVNAGLDVPGLLDTLAPNGRLHNVGAVLDPLPVPAFSLIAGQKSVSGSPTGSPTAIDDMLEFSARHSIAPITETFPMSKVNEALEHLRAGKARYRIVLANDEA